MRWAKPSTIAVLPTPGSPIRTGLFFLRRASTSIVVSISARAADHRIELAFAGELCQITRIFVEVGRVRRRLDLSLLGAAADHLDDLLADRLRRQAVAAQNVASDAFLLLRKADQEMLRADIGMAELARGGRRGRGRS